MNLSTILNKDMNHSFYSLFFLENLMKKKQLIILEKLEYDVYKNENETKIKKLITLDDYFEISTIKNKMI